eukprot:9546093-Alexandrium_andersonii.AAC.1
MSRGLAVPSAQPPGRQAAASVAPCGAARAESPNRAAPDGTTSARPPAGDGKTPMRPRPCGTRSCWERSGTSTR